MAQALTRPSPLLLLVGLGIAIASLSLVSVAGASVSSCTVQEAPAHGSPPTAAVQEFQAAVIHADAARPGVGKTMEAALGSQFGGVWFNDDPVGLEVGLAPGSKTLGEASAALDAYFTSALTSSQLEKLRVVGVQVSTASVLADLATVDGELRQTLPSLRYSIGENNRGPQSSPQLDVELYGGVTDAECEAALTIVERYGPLASLTRTNMGQPGPAEAIDARPTPPKSSAIRFRARLGRKIRLQLAEPRNGSGPINLTLSFLHGTRVLSLLHITINSGGHAFQTVTVTLPKTARRANALRIRAVDQTDNEHGEKTTSLRQPRKH